jgi:hypothetical protein
LWATALRGDTWAGQIGENVHTEQSFTTVATAADNSLDAVTEFAQTCSQYTATGSGQTIDLVR